MKTNTQCNSLKPARRFKASILTASVVAVLAMTYASLSVAENTKFGQVRFLQTPQEISTPPLDIMHFIPTPLRGPTTPLDTMRFFKHRRNF